MNISQMKKVSKTQMTSMILESGGRFFTSTHIGKDGELHTLTGRLSKNPRTNLGYIRMYCPNVGYRNLNPRTLKRLNIDNSSYIAK